MTTLRRLVFSSPQVVTNDLLNCSCHPVHKGIQGGFVWHTLLFNKLSHLSQLANLKQPKAWDCGALKGSCFSCLAKRKVSIIPLVAKKFLFEMRFNHLETKKGEEILAFMNWYVFSFLLFVPNHNTHTPLVYQVVWIFLYRHINLYPELLGRFQSKIEVVVFFRVCARV